MRAKVKFKHPHVRGRDRWAKDQVDTVDLDLAFHFEKTDVVEIIELIVEETASGPIENAVESAPDKAVKETTGRRKTTTRARRKKAE